MLLVWVLNNSILRVPAVAIPSTTAQSVAANVWTSMIGPRRIPGSRSRSGQPRGSLHGTCGVQIGGVFLAKAAFGASSAAAMMAARSPVDRRQTGRASGFRRKGTMPPLARNTARDVASDEELLRLSGDRVKVNPLRGR